MGYDENSQMEGSMGIQTSRPHTAGRPNALAAVLASLALAAAVAAGTGAAAAAGPSAKAATTINLSDSARLHENNHKGLELKESGTARGNLPGSIFIQLRIAGRSVTASIQLYQGSKDALTASASAVYSVRISSTATFSGNMRITGGRGRYAKAKGSGLSFSGSVHRPGNAVSVHVSGKLSY